MRDTLGRNLAITAARDTQMRSECGSGGGHDIVGAPHHAKQIDERQLKRLPCQEFVTIE